MHATQKKAGRSSGCSTAAGSTRSYPLCAHHIEALTLHAPTRYSRWWWAWQALIALGHSTAFSDLCGHRGASLVTGARCPSAPASLGPSASSARPAMPLSKPRHAESTASPAADPGLSVPSSRGRGPREPSRSQDPLGCPSAAQRSATARRIPRRRRCPHLAVQCRGGGGVAWHEDVRA